jgi:alkaline phosphatase
VFRTPTREEEHVGARRTATIAATLTGTAALAALPTWTDAARRDEQSRHGHGRAVARNVIVLQGDGMAAAQRDLIRLVAVGNKKGKDLRMNRLQHTGLVHTDPADPDEAVTDSAAAATAFSTGVKTFNGAVGVDVNGKPVPTLLEDARRAGMATGLVTTSQVTDATPAAYGAHVSDRAQQSEIARQFLEVSKPDVILGGGEDFWYPAGDPGGLPDHPATDPTEASKGTLGNLVDRARSLGYDYVSDREGLRQARARKLLGLFANEEMFEHREEGDGDLYDPAVPLPEMATKALDLLSRDRDGLFVLIEEEGIDEMAHENNARLMIKAGAALDATVAVAVAFARRHPGTLIVVQGDHETGGLTIENPGDADESGDDISREDGPFTVAGTDLKVFADWTTNQHTGVDTPITASGPGSARFDGVIDNTDVHDNIARAMRRR